MGKVFERAGSKYQTLIIVATIFLYLFFLLGALRFPAEAARGPIFISSLGLFLVILPALINFFGQFTGIGRKQKKMVEIDSSGGNSPFQEAAPSDQKRLYPVILCTIGYVVLFKITGYILATTFFILAMLMLLNRGKNRWFIALGGGVGIALIMYAIFDLLLKIPLPGAFGG